MNHNEINTALTDKDLPKLERHFFLRYKGCVPDAAEYDATLDKYCLILDSRGTSRNIYVDPKTGKYRSYSSSYDVLLERHRTKMLLIDAILTLKHERAIETVTGRNDFCIFQQLAEVN